LWILVGVELAIIIFTDLINRWTSLTDSLLGDQYSIQTSVTIINKAAEVDISDLENSEFYDKLERARQQTSGRVGLLSNVLGQIQDIIVVLSLVAGLIYFSPWLIVLLLLSIFPGFVNEVKFSNSSYSLSRGWTAERRELDYLRYIGANDKTAKEIKLFNLSSFISDRFQKLSYSYYLENRKLSIRRNLFGALYAFIGTLSYYGAYVLIIYRTVIGLISIGDLTFLSGSFNRLKTRLESMFSRFTRISESALYLNDYYEFIDQKAIQKNNENLELPKKIKEGFVFEDLHFKYPEAETEVLKGVSFNIKAGEKMAFVGENGAGKSTLIKLILRFYEPTAGRILLDGIDIRRYDKAKYQEMFGVIFQDFVKYELSLRENIAVGKIAYIDDEKKILAASDMSLAKEVIDDVPEGLSQKLGKRFAKGLELSGGQWQKIALARAYMKDAPVLILDEPTSALDARAEYEAFQRFIGLTEGKTSIIISHRFSTVRMADRILVLKNGLISEIGTHEELLQNADTYKELFELQAAGYQ
jgi:ATP-binding cassette subfamily B protein